MHRVRWAVLIPVLLAFSCAPISSGDAPFDAGMDAGASEEPIDEEPIDEEPIDEEPIDEEPIDEEPIDAGAVAPPPADAGTAVVDAGAADPQPPVVEPPAADSGGETEMTYTTANIGRDYDTAAFVQAVFDDVGDVIGPKPGPRFIGWQEIGEADPCGSACEIDALEDRFASASGWTNRRPQGQQPSGAFERVKVPVTSKGAGGSVVRATYASAGWEGISPTRFVTVVHYADHNVSIIDTHFIAGAWSCKSHVAQRREYWQDAWGVLKSEVAAEHGLGRNVVVTGDLNRGRSANSCNPAWEPTSLHGRAKVVGGAGIDYVFAVPAAGNKFIVSTRADGTLKKGSITLGIDGHSAHWVSGRFLPQ